MEWIWIAAVIIIFLGGFVFLSAPGSYEKGNFDAFFGRNFAHRGLHSPDKSVPENSLAAFEAARDAGYGIELDVQLSRDGQIVVFHDDELERVCGLNERVDKLSFEELGELRLERTDERIPLFSEVLALVNGAVPLIVELKTGPQNDRLCVAVHKILSEYDGDFCIESFDPRIVRWFKENAPEILRGQLSAPPEVMENGLGGLVIAWGFSHFLGRPQFIAYQAVTLPLGVHFARFFAFRVVWTLTPTHQAKHFLEKNDAAIFEHYTPPQRFK